MALPRPQPQPLDPDGGSQSVKVQRWQHGRQQSLADRVAEECAVALVYNGISHVVMMASPRDLEEFALGFSLSEGIVQGADEVYAIEVHHQPRGYELQIAISSQRMVALKQRRRNLAGRTGCGLCGAESLQQAIRPTARVTPQPLPSANALQRAVRELTDWQPLQAQTGAVHGAAWCDSEGEIQLLREDVGRHNALDKLIGALQLQRIGSPCGFALVSSRASYEMVQKAASIDIATLVAVSAPTSLAIELARQAGLNLIGFARPGRHVIYTPSS